MNQKSNQKNNNRKSRSVVNETTKYGSLKIHPSQPKHRKHDPALEASIIKHGGNIQPGQVNKHKVILDGHGRFHYCKKNNLPFSYITVDEGEHNLISELNTTGAAWRLIDHIESYGATNNDYKMLYNILQKHGIAFSVIDQKLALTEKHVKAGLPLNIDFADLEAFILFHKEIIKLTHITATRAVARALASFDRVQKFDRERMIASVTKHWTRLNPEVIGGDQFISKQLSEVYDYKSRSKLKLYYLVNS